MQNKKTEAWRNFKGEEWKHKINVSDFIQQNYSEYTGTGDFLVPPTEKTKKIAKMPKKDFQIRLHNVYKTIFLPVKWRENRKFRNIRPAKWSVSGEKHSKRAR